MANTEYVLKTTADGAIWSHRVKKTGAVSGAGNRVSPDEAARMVESGEAAYDAASKPASRAPSAAEMRDAHECDVQEKADRGVQIQPRDWSRAMNRDD